MQHPMMVSVSVSKLIDASEMGDFLVACYALGEVADVCACPAPIDMVEEVITADATKSVAKKTRAAKTASEKYTVPPSSMDEVASASAERATASVERAAFSAATAVPAEPAPSLESVRAAIGEIVRAAPGKQSLVRGLIVSHGADSVTELAAKYPERLADFLTQAKAL